MAGTRKQWVCALGPGSANDLTMYALAEELRHAIDNLPGGMYALGDAAYPLGDRLLVPFTGDYRDDRFHDSFNFFLSQLRIRVEMAFGRLVTKFRILGGRVEGSLERVSSVLMACARLHNFIIRMEGPPRAEDVVAVVSEEEDEEAELSREVSPVARAPLGMGYLPVVPNPNDVGDLADGVSHQRDAIVHLIRTMGYDRPDHNLARQRARQNVFVFPDGDVVHRNFLAPR